MLLARWCRSLWASFIVGRSCWLVGWLVGSLLVGGLLVGGLLVGGLFVGCWLAVCNFSHKMALHLFALLGVEGGCTIGGGTGLAT